MSGRNRGMGDGDEQSMLKPPPTSPEMKRQAALTTCHFAVTFDDARELLTMLGLLEDPDVT
jgi:hypothetical protein